MSTISSGTTSTTTLIHSGDTTGSLVFKTNDTGSGGTTAMTIDTSQNVGIGTTSPGYKLETSGSIYANGIELGWNGDSIRRAGDLYVGTTGASTNLFLRTNGTTRATIDSSSGNATFTKDVITNGGKFSIQGSGTEYGYVSTASGDVTFGSSNGGYLKLNSAGSLLIGYTSSGEAFRANGTNFAVAGALSKGSGSFRIEHPLPSLSNTHQLVHSFIEGPQADLIYRGKVNLVNGQAQINIDSVAKMTEGTFEVLCRDVQCFTSNESDWCHVRGSVTGNILNIEAQDNTSTALVSWMVIGERKDKHIMHTDWTDENGKVIVEPLKDVETNSGTNTESQGE